MEVQQNFLCHLCGKGFPTKYQHKRHQYRHNNNCICNICSKSVHGKTALQHHMDFAHRNKTLKCPHCDKTYKSYGGYIAHKSTHAQEEHECKDCGRKFSKKTALYRHRGKAHVTPKQKCDTCGKLFHHPSHLEQHMKTHMGDEARTHKCPTCPASFKWPKALAKHQTTHEGKKTCTICNKDYNGSRQLKRHMSTAHKEQSSI
ncbi:zinc finger protein 568-like [Branchiostoma floridae]|uniref:Zinc finger protein 568-like n=1 Tax=Branchiostoma floridae TaxID=7739 RepID=A0A9J7HDS3_BRAFL|nr:zinc finger protein 568-like [Branchiostoma floridae]